MSKRRTVRATKKLSDKDAFIAALAEHGVVQTAAKECGLARRTVYDWRDTDESFSKAWDAAVDDSTEKLEREAIRRAAEGTLKPVFQNGKKVGVIREFSDVLLIFLLKARRPKVYRDNVRHELGGPDGGPIQHQHGVLVAPAGVSLDEWTKQATTVNATIASNIAAANALGTGTEQPK